MRIALLTAEYPPQPGGVGDYTRRLGESLVDRGHDVHVFTIADCRFQIVDLAERDPNLQSTIYNLQSNWGWGSWRDVIAALERTRPDVLHIQYQTGAYGMRPAINLLPWRLRRLPRRPAIAVTAHDLLLPYLFPKAGPLRTWITRRLLADADAVVVTNEADYVQVAREWRLEMSKRRLDSSSQSPISNLQSPVLIPIGSNISVAPPASYERMAWRARLGVAPDDTLVAYFGLISHTKGLDVLLDALAQLPVCFRLLAVGGAATAPDDRAYAEAIGAQIARLGLDQRVTLTGHCAEAEVSAHLLAADLAALPFADGASFRRGSMLAALAHGLPVVTTQPIEPRTGTRRVNQEPDHYAPVLGRVPSGWFSVLGLVDGENVLLAPPGDARALAAAIERLAREAALRKRLGANGRALAARFGWPAIAAQHEELYARLVRQSGTFEN